MIARPASNRGAVVHSVVAAALSDPGRLQTWSTDPAQLMRYEVDPSALDLDALADFAGLSEKIRHNGCRDHLPMTFQLLNLSGLEIELFRDYAPTSLRRRQRGPASPMDRIEGLAAFVGAWAEDGDPLRTLIRDALRHEQTVALLRSADQDQSACPTAGSPPLAVPAPNGHLRVHILSCDPRSLQRILADRPAHLLDIERGRWTFIYHRTAERLRVLEVEHAVGDLITAVDGRSSVRDIAARLFGDPDETQALNSLFEQLVEIGLLRWGTGGAEQCG